MMKVYRYLAVAAIVLSACGASGKENPDNKKENYRNEFSLIGRIEEPGVWQEDEEILALDPSDGSVVGKARLTQGEGTRAGAFSLKTNLEAGSSVILKRNAGIDANQKQKSADAQDIKPYSPGTSAPVQLSASWPSEFTMSQDYCILSIIPVAGKHIGEKLAELSFACEGADLAGGASAVRLKLGTALSLTDENPALEITVAPSDLSGKDCSVSILGEELHFTGRALEKGKRYGLRIVLPDGVLIPGTSGGNEFSPINVQYKKTAETAAYSTAKAITVNGMNRMAHYAADPTDRWGGYAGVHPDSYVSTNTAGFWRTGKYQGRWVCVNPDGNVTILHGVNGVAPNFMKEASSALAQEEYDKKFASEEEWAEWAGHFLADNSFNFYSTNPKRIRIYRENYPEGVQALMRDADGSRKLSQVEILYLLRTFSWDYNSLTGKSFDAAKGSVFTLMFDPAYLDYIDALAKDGTALFKDDKAFIGYYIDNELQFRFASASTPAIYLKHWLALDTSSSSPRAFTYAKAYAENFMREKYNVEPLAANVTTAMDDAFLADICDYYYRTATSAIRKYDPNHLILGSRLHGKPKTLKQVHAACATYCDIVSVNVYGVWEPNDDYFISQFKSWVNGSKPCFVTEFYTRDALASFAGQSYGNTGEGGGWIVKGQQSRGQYYQNFVRKLISYDHCIGWQWFQMTDDYSETYGWNNKGVVNPAYEPYYGLTDMMRQLHWNIYQIMDYYHSPGGASDQAADSVQCVFWE